MILMPKCISALIKNLKKKGEIKWKNLQAIVNNDKRINTKFRNKNVKKAVFKMSNERERSLEPTQFLEGGKHAI